MKNLFVILLSILLFSSCSSDTGPLLEVKIVTTKSDIFQEAELDVSSFRLFDAGSGVSDIQEWSGNLSELDLTKIDTSIVLDRFHWEMDLGAVRPDFTGRIMKDGEWKNLNVEYFERVLLMDALLIEDNKEYEVLIHIDADNAFIETGEIIQFDWNHVTAEAFEK